MNNRPQRKSPRLQGYDYTHSGAYFVTICTGQKTHLFGEVIEASMEYSPLGRIAYDELACLSLRWQTVDVDLFVVMPNHLHAIIVLSPDETSQSNTRSVDAQKSDAQKRVSTLGMVIGNYKGGVTRIARERNIIDESGGIWQGRYHDHIIRDERGLNMIRQYILDNPLRWEADTFYS